MKYVFLLVWFAIGVSGCVYLVMNSHPWFACAVLLVTASIRISESSPTQRAVDGAEASAKNGVYYVEWVDADTIRLTPRH